MRVLRGGLRMLSARSERWMGEVFVMRTERGWGTRKRFNDDSVSQDCGYMHCI